VMVAQVPAYHITTIYSMIGDLLGWFAVVGLVVISVWTVASSWISKRAPKNEKPSQRLMDEAPPEMHSDQQPLPGKIEF
jgi:hypothetical protein